MRLAFSLFAAAALLAGATTAEAASGAQWNARDPVTDCPEFRDAEPPGNDGVVALFRCSREEITSGDELWLVEDPVIQVGEGRPNGGYNEMMSMPNADTTKPVYPLTGSWTWFTCRDPKYTKDAALNCSRAEVTKAQGACWMTTDGVWRCNMTGTTGARTEGHAPPR
ncbi:hypothetical protein sos41_31960 [Alphaproteobacteria bacterium SO-S41]|nr:hypothetical protein sos41_31960 [Alphaproteobacteria bacterium SO-S41]